MNLAENLYRMPSGRAKQGNLELLLNHKQLFNSWNIISYDVLYLNILYNENPASADVLEGVRMTTPNAANDDKAAGATPLMPVYTVIKPMQQLNV